mmetsp:Transcript_22690/g.31705  ORF Transcript_22690/g.31705 Transcript_22690/m.31705 type:complete len:923 (-) Transcript_22690:235-3003(-)
MILVLITTAYFNFNKSITCYRSKEYIQTYILVFIKNQVLQNIILIQKSVLKFFNLINRQGVINYLGIIINSLGQNHYWLDKSDYCLNFGNQFIFKHLQNYKEKVRLIKSGLNFLVMNTIFKELTDNLNLTENSEYLFPGDLYSTTFYKGLVGLVYKIIYNNRKMSLRNTLKKLSNKVNRFNLKNYHVHACFNSVYLLVALGYFKNITSKSDKQSGYSILLERINIIQFISNFDLVYKGSFVKNQKLISTRIIDIDSIGYVCPIQTPDGSSSGVINHLSMLAHIRLVEIEEYYHKMLGVSEVLTSFNTECKTFEKNKCCNYVEITKSIDFQNNFISCRNCINRCVHFIHFLKKLSYHSTIFQRSDLNNFNHLCFIEIYIITGDALHSILQIRTQSNTLLKLMKQINNCYFEFIGSSEIHRLDIIWDQQFEYQSKKIFTHQNLGVFGMLSFAAYLIPFSNFNQSPRNIYQCQMGKQAIGYNYENINNRSFSKLLYIFYPQRPLCDKKIFLTNDINLFPYGNNVIISICSYSLYDMEDACVLSKGSIDFGLFYSVIVQSNNFKKKPFDIKKHTKKNKLELSLSFYTKLFKSYKNLDPTLLAVSHILMTISKYRTNLVPGVHHYNKYSKEKANNFDEFSVPVIKSIKLLNHLETVINRNFIIKRKPIVGDKVASRHGQKSIISFLMSKEDLPFENFTGILPDLLINPHSFPSRMTIGMLKEIIVSKSCSLTGTSYKRDYRKIQKLKYTKWYMEFSNNIYAYDIGENGESFYLDGKTGADIKSSFFTGIVFYQRLIQMVKDKIQMRYSGKVAKTTLQPIKGRKHGGGIKIGEMEKDAFLAHSAFILLNDRMLKSSDYIILQLCVNCSVLLRLHKNNIINQKNDLLDLYKEKKCCFNPLYKLILVPNVLLHLIDEIIKVGINLSINYP